MSFTVPFNLHSSAFFVVVELFFLIIARDFSQNTVLFEEK